MKKTLFKLLCICLITVLITSTLMACGRDTGVTPTDTPATAAPQTPDEPSEEPAETVDPIKFTIWTGNADPGDFVDEDPVHQYIREVLGVDIEFQYTATDATEQLTLMLTSSSYPDALHLKPEEIMDNHITGTSGGSRSLSGKHAPWLYEYMASKPSAFSLGIEDYSGRFFYVPGSFGYTEDFLALNPPWVSVMMSGECWPKILPINPNPRIWMSSLKWPRLSRRHFRNKMEERRTPFPDGLEMIGVLSGLFMPFSVSAAPMPGWDQLLRLTIGNKNTALTVRNGCGACVTLTGHTGKESPIRKL